MSLVFVDSPISPPSEVSDAPSENSGRAPQVGLRTRGLSSFPKVPSCAASRSFCPFDPHDCGTKRVMRPVPMARSFPHTAAGQLRIHTGFPVRRDRLFRDGPSTCNRGRDSPVRPKCQSRDGKGAVPVSIVNDGSRAGRRVAVRLLTCPTRISLEPAPMFLRVS